MESMGSDRIRREFLGYFERNGHTVVPSSSLVPHNDPTLLFTNAGMVQFKDVFLGTDRRPYTRAVTSQKCVRAGGKHNDLENVGYTARHHTFFEMLGNFSFGDYFKREAVRYAWEFLTEVLGLPRERLWFTVFRDDDEAAALWRETAGVTDDRIVRLGEKDNFWAMGDTGPCGPCSEVVIDRGEQYSCGAPECFIGKCDCDRWLEIWNLVFMQFNRDRDGKLTPLPKPSVDTGMGLERIASVLQGVDTNFDTDLFTPIIEKISELGGEAPGGGKVFAYRVIADHARACTFLVADGVIPGNEGRGYVLRRILRRAVRYGRVLGIDGPFLHRLVPAVGSVMGKAYPEVVERADLAARVIGAEEERFLQTLEQGMKMVSDLVERAAASDRREIDGRDAFMLYDTYGFPFDLTRDIARENGLEVDRAGFESAMDEQRRRAREARRAGAREYDAGPCAALQDVPATVFTGYTGLSSRSTVIALLKDGDRVPALAAGDHGEAVLDATPFYAESGGQVSDSGVIRGPSGTARVEDSRRLPGGRVAHEILVEQGVLAEGDGVTAVVDEERRAAVRRSHTATHLIHRALKMVVGDHANQAGSLVAPDRLRFDFTHFAPLSVEEIRKIERLVNSKVMEDTTVEVAEMALEEARAEGAVALFGEKYGDRVRVVRIGDFSKELCGGTHVSATGEIGAVKIVSESGIGSGLRRLEAVTGCGALAHVEELERLLEDAAAVLKAVPAEIPARAADLASRVRALEREVERLRAVAARRAVNAIASGAVRVGDSRIACGRVEADSIEALRSMGDALREEIGSGVVVLAAALEDKACFVSMVTDDLVGRGVHAGKIVKEAARAAGGGGGGRADMAEAGAKDAGGIRAALERALEFARTEVASALGV
ncbi:MAG: alanine--tRNA ligase [Firmicutes bacterium]|jgi:alanyl-tRNA synthetase|nr:alanine--tRNA ligase [Bacillota bacterium]